MTPSADAPSPVRLRDGALGLGESALGPADPPPLRLRVRLLGGARGPLGGLRQPAAEDRWRDRRGARVGGQRLRDQASRTLLLRDALVLAAQRRGARVLGEPIAVVALLVAGAGSAFRVRRRVRTRAVGQHAGIDRALVPVVALGTADAPAVLAMTVDSAGIVGGAGRARLRHVARDAAGPRAAWVAAGQVDALSADAVPALFGAVAGFCILTVLVLLTATWLRRVLAAYLRVAGLRRAGRAIVARYRLVHAATPALARVDRAGVSVVTRDAVTHDEAVLAAVVHRAIVPVIALYRTAAAALGLRGPRAAVHAVRRFASAAEAGLDDTAGRAAVACGIVAVVALLAVGDPAVAATRARAVRIAAVAGHVVDVVTLFASVDDAVPAALGAVVLAEVEEVRDAGVGAVPIVARSSDVQAVQDGGWTRRSGDGESELIAFVGGGIRYGRNDRAVERGVVRGCLEDVHRASAWHSGDAVTRGSHEEIVAEIREGSAEVALRLRHRIVEVTEPSDELIAREIIILVEREVINDARVLPVAVVEGGADEDVRVLLREARSEQIVGRRVGVRDAAEEVAARRVEQVYGTGAPDLLLVTIAGYRHGVERRADRNPLRTAGQDRHGAAELRERGRLGPGELHRPQVRARDVRRPRVDEATVDTIVSRGAPQCEDQTTTGSHRGRGQREAQLRSWSRRGIADQDQHVVEADVHSAGILDAPGVVEWGPHERRPGDRRDRAAEPIAGDRQCLPELAHELAGPTVVEVRGSRVDHSIDVAARGANEHAERVLRRPSEIEDRCDRGAELVSGCRC